MKELIGEITIATGDPNTFIKERIQNIKSITIEGKDIIFLKFNGEIKKFKYKDFRGIRLETYFLKYT